ncbi:MAG: hypothetical protein EA427_01200 [Spirochaetaceae bacterium]|nr:MAG: hypothetical protein EA427_01200 [Spirochaetaceae bacterium]
MNRNVLNQDGHRIGLRACMVLPVLLLLSGLSWNTPLNAQSFRGEPTVLLEITEATPIRSELEAGQVLMLAIPDSYPFVEALTIQLISPEEELLVPGAFSLSAYSAIDPALAETSGYVTFAGRLLGTVPVESAQTYTIPVLSPSRSDDITESASTAFREADPRIGAIALQIAPAMKGVGAHLEEIAFLIEIRPVTSRKGGVRVELTGEEGVLERAREVLHITLEGEPLQEGEILFRTPGIYRLEVNAGDYLQHTENVGIDAARTTTALLEAREPRAFLAIHVPSVAEVFLGGERISASPRSTLEHPPGSYILLIRMGDFVISRRVRFEANRKYQIGLDLDIMIKED